MPTKRSTVRSRSRALRLTPKLRAVLSRIVARARRAITADVKAGIVPRTVRTVGGLGSYVDQNMYFLDADGNFDPELDELCLDIGNGTDGEMDCQPMWDFLGQSQDRVEAWMKSGALTRLPVARKTTARRGKVANPSHETPYEVGVRVGRMNAETALESLDSGLMELAEDETRADAVSEYARIASIEESREGAVFYDEPEMRGGRYNWEEFEAGVHKGIELAVDRDAKRPKRNPSRRRKAPAKRAHR